MNTKKKFKGFLILTAVLIALFSLKLVQAQTPPPTPPPMPNQIETFTFNLKAGWNMISSPISLIESLPRPLTLNDIKNCNFQSVWQFNTAANSYKEIKLNNPLDVMTGYWAFLEKDCTATIKGIRNDSSKNLYAGWNMISSKYSWDKIKNNCKILSKIYHFNPAKNGYDEIPESDKLNDIQGYWIFVNNKCQINEKTNNEPPPPTQSVKINSISPNKARIGAKITIFGSGFTENDNNIAFKLNVPSNYTFQTGYINGITSFDGKSLSFVMPEGLSACTSPMKQNEACPEILLRVTGKTQIWVINKNGTSNSVNFTVVK